MQNKKTLRNQEIFKLVYASALAAIIAILTWLGGYINLNIVQVTFIHIPVIIGAVILGRRYGLLLGFVFGLGSFIRSLIEVIPQNVSFTNPLLAILPRMAFGYVAAVLYEWFRKFTGKVAPAALLAGVISTLIHTMIVVPFLFVVAKTGFHFYAAEHRYIIEEGFFAFLLLVIVNNMLLEIATAALIGTPIIIALNKVMTQNPAQA